MKVRRTLGVSHRNGNASTNHRGVLFAGALVLVAGAFPAFAGAVVDPPDRNVWGRKTQPVAVLHDYYRQLDGSASNRYVVFTTNYKLVGRDTNRDSDIYVFDRKREGSQNPYRLVSVSSREALSNGDSGDWNGVSISSDGRFVAFDSSASNLAPGDLHRSLDLFLRDRAAGTTRRINVLDDGYRIPRSFHPTVADGGRIVTFAVDNYPDEGATIYAWRRAKGYAVPLNTETDPWTIDDPNLHRISADGSVEVFCASDRFGDGPGTSQFLQVFTYSLGSGSLTQVSETRGGDDGNADSCYSDDSGYGLDVSKTGRFIAFNSKASNLNPANARQHRILLWDRSTGAIRTVHHLGGDPYELSLEPHGTSIAYVATSTDSGYKWDVGFTRIGSNESKWVSVTRTGALSGSSHVPHVAVDSRSIAFRTFDSRDPMVDARGSSTGIFIRIGKTH